MAETIELRFKNMLDKDVVIAVTPPLVVRFTRRDGARQRVFVARQSAVRAIILSEDSPMGGPQLPFPVPGLVPVPGVRLQTDDPTASPDGALGGALSSLENLKLNSTLDGPGVCYETEEGVICW